MHLLKNEKRLLPKNISWNQLISNSNLSKLLVNTLHSRNSCQIVRDWIFDFSTLCESEFLNFPHCGLQTWSSRNVSFSLLCFSIHSKAFKRSVEIAAYNNKIQNGFVGGNVKYCRKCVYYWKKVYFRICLLLPLIQCCQLEIFSKNIVIHIWQPL